ncbi:MAG: adenosylmethionine decarboxylase [Nitrososphaerota archaeon]|nr:adenosylmethionine decarboxylase [Aigarchaeota archaeon]MDW8077024.1 adenosylmethionine decarboxylase [Nitrososphaerota archaeon]
MKGLGRHLIVELYGCDVSILGDLEALRTTLLEAAEASGAKVLGEFFKKFPRGGGVTGILAIAESHLSVHTWPEYSYAAVDLFTCGDHVDPWKAYEIICRNMKPTRTHVRELKRGLIEVEEIWEKSEE